jgi:endonuclease/exonuclease/phosphatase family metal-dependent hydrolase
MRLLTWNIHKGFSAGGRRFTLPGQRAALAIVAADLVLLQEVQGAHDRRAARITGWPEEGQAHFLAAGGWPHVAYGANARHRHGHHGNALLSRWPLAGWRNHDVSNHALERRGILDAVVEAPGGRLRVLVAHLDLTAWGRVRQARRLAALLAEAPGLPTVVAGDFNDWRRAMAAGLGDIGLADAHLAVNGRPARTFPAAAPLLPLDRLYLHGLAARSARVLAGAPWRGLSDHLPLAVEI